jgi:hypothetical protein
MVDDASIQNRGGRPPFKPTEADRLFVDRAVMAGMNINDIAGCLNINPGTLRSHFRYEITTARARLRGKAIEVLSNSLDDGSLDAAKFVLARIAGWTEKQNVDISNSDGTLAQKTIDVSKLSADALREIAGLEPDA